MSKIIGVEDIDIVKYEKKFEDWDFVESSGSFTSAKALELLSDVTVWSYAFLRLEGFRLKLYPYQDLIVNDKSKRVLVAGANQTGKSLALDVLACYNLCNNYCENTVIVSKSLPQAKFQVSRIRNLLNNSVFKSDWKSDVGDSESASLISLNVKNSKGEVVGVNRVIVAPCTEGLLGYDVHHLYPDEFDYYEVDQDYFYNRIAEPRTYSTKGNIIIFSNPNGVDKYMYKLWNQKNKSGEALWSRYRFNYLAKPGNTMEEYEELRSRKSRVDFECTVDAIFSLGASGFIDYDLVLKSYDPKLNDDNCTIDKDCYFFLDVGVKHDKSVLTGCFIEPVVGSENLYEFKVFLVKVYPVGYPLSLVLGVKNGIVNNDEQGWEYVESVIEVLKTHQKGGVLPVLGIDLTSNSAVKNLVEQAGVPVTEVIFSGPKKWAMYQRVKYLLEKGLLKRCRSEQLELEFRDLQVERTVRNYGKIHAAPGGFDDIPDGIVGVVNIADPANFEQVRIDIIGGEKL